MLDQTSVKKIVEENYVKINNLALAMLKDADAAEDVTQEVFVFFLENSSELEDKNIYAWLINVTKNKVYEEYRRIRKTNKKTAEPDEKSFSFVINENILNFDRTPDLTDDEIFNAKEKILNLLSPDEKKLFSYIYTQKMNYKSIAKLLDTNEKNIGVRAVRLRKKIKNMTKTAFIITLFIAVKLKVI